MKIILSNCKVGPRLLLIANLYVGVVIVLLLYLNVILISDPKYVPQESSRRIPSLGGGTADGTTTTKNLTTRPRPLGTDLADSSRDRVRLICNCSGMAAKGSKAKNSGELPPSSSCSDEATMVGAGQNVISYSLFTMEFWKFKGHEWQERKKALYRSGFQFHIESMREFYPGWIMRIYTNLRASELCDFACEEDVFICDVQNLPNFGNLTNVNPMVWRLLVLGDPTVLKFIVRDSDALISVRERVAVEEWAISGRSFHATRDHPYHRSPIMGCCWGGNNALIGFETASKLAAEILHEAGKSANGDYGDDQQILKTVLYNRFKSQFLIHDSYHCNDFNDSSVPFPVERLDAHDVVGLSGFSSHHRKQRKPGARLHGDLPTCPYECRPAYGKNWTYC